MKSIKIKNYANGTEYVDRLCTKSELFTKTSCTEKQCKGNLRAPLNNSRKPRPLEEIMKHAKVYLEEYYSHLNELDSEMHKKRWTEIENELNSTGTYELTIDELIYGVKLAWRNASGCINRIQWHHVHVFDARDVTTASGMFDAILRHIRYATNGGKIRSTVTVFRQRTNGLEDLRIWNQYVPSYAGYKNKDGTITGDPLNVEFTEICLKLGWKGKRTRFDILPVLLSVNGEDPELFEIPENDIMFVPIAHPTIKCIEEMGIKWYALPGVTRMGLDIGGLEFPYAPFNGWTMGSKLGARDLSDTYRYNILEELATKMGLDNTNVRTLWKDKALVELNIAILDSFHKAGVSITDHHSASEGFLNHLEHEFNVRGGCPVNWTRVVPPMSSSVLGIFHQEVTDYHLKPSWEYQIPPWETHQWKKLAVCEENNQDGKD